MAKTGYNRASRVADQIRMEVADIIMRKTKDPRVGSVTVTDVDLTGDLRQAHVYFTTLTPEADVSEVQLGLARAAGFIRSELGRRLQLRYTPELRFHQDLSGPQGDRILTILENLERDGNASACRGANENLSGEKTGEEPSEGSATLPGKPS
jgi:ribosome-binding factor A